MFNSFVVRETPSFRIYSILQSFTLLDGFNHKHIQVNVLLIAFKLQSYKLFELSAQVPASLRIALDKGLETRDAAETLTKRRFGYEPLLTVVVYS